MAAQRFICVRVVSWIVFLPSPFGRRAGDEGLREETIFLDRAPL